MRALLGAGLALVLIAAGAFAQGYRPAEFVLYGHGQGGDGLGHGFQDGHIDMRTRAHSEKPTPDSRPWGFHDNSVPGQRAHGMRFSQNHHGRTHSDPRVEYIGDRPARGRHNATLRHDRRGRPVYE